VENDLGCKRRNREVDHLKEEAKICKEAAHGCISTIIV
jgi:hypothetical protein